MHAANAITDVHLAEHWNFGQSDMIGLSGSEKNEGLATCTGYFDYELYVLYCIKLQCICINNDDSQDQPIY